jgi:hypothetical protein
MFKLSVLTPVQEVKIKKKQCQLLADRVITITAAIAVELMNADPATLVRRENSVAAWRGCVQILPMKFIC